MSRLSSRYHRGGFRPFERVKLASLTCDEAGVDGEHVSILGRSFEQKGVIELNVAVVGDHPCTVGIFSFTSAGVFIQ